VDVSKIRIDGVSVAVFLRLGNRARVYDSGGAKPGVGQFSHVRLSEITATNTSEIGCSITGLPGHPVEDVTLSDITIGCDGGGTRDQAARAIAEREDAYPESTMFGVLPAYGFFCRHVRGLTFRNVKLQTTQPDLRHALVFDDVEELRIDRLEAPQAGGAAAPIRFTQVRSAVVRDCPAPVTVDPPSRP